MKAEKAPHVAFDLTLDRLARELRSELLEVDAAAPRCVTIQPAWKWLLDAACGAP